MILPETILTFQTLGLYYFQQSSNDSGAGGVFLCCILPIALIVGIFAFSIWSTNQQKAEKLRREQEDTKNMTPEEKAEYYEKKRKSEQLSNKIATYGSTSPAMICPHCQTKGQVRTKKVTQKKGISGSKATGAVLTGGISVLATGLSRKEDATQAHCDKCDSTWHF
jgi:uncharacterized protein HemX